MIMKKVRGGVIFQQIHRYELFAMPINSIDEKSDGTLRFRLGDT